MLIFRLFSDQVTGGGRLWKPELCSNYDREDDFDVIIR